MDGFLREFLLAALEFFSIAPPLFFQRAPEMAKAIGCQFVAKGPVATDRIPVRVHRLRRGSHRSFFAALTHKRRRSKFDLPQPEAGGPERRSPTRRGLKLHGTRRVGDRRSDTQRQSPQSHIES